MPQQPAPDAGTQVDPAPPTGGYASTRAVALALWVVVGSLLVYGIAQTVLKASALFA